MIDFNFSLKTKIFFGKNKELEIGNILNSYGYQRVVILIGQSSVAKSGLLDKILECLDNSNISYMIIQGIEPNPDIDLVRSILVEVRKFEPECLLPIGGGSVMDTAKSLAVSYYYDGDPFDFNLHILTSKKALPIGAIVTIAASGSEASTSCVMSDNKTHIKLGFNSELVVPIFAIEDPVLTFSVSPTQTAYGIVDILMHTMERYFCQSSENEPCDRFAEGLMKSVISAGKKVMENPYDYEARAGLMLMASFSHNGLTSVGKKAWLAVHQLEHPLSGLYPFVAHAAGLSVLWPAWAKFYYKYDIDKFDSFARNVFGSYIENKEENARMGIALVEQFFHQLNMPHTFNDLGIESPDIDALVNQMTHNGTRVVDHHVKPMDQEVARIIYMSCLTKEQ